MKSTVTKEMQQVIDTHAGMGPLPIESLTPEQARQIPLPDRAAAAVYGQHITKRVMAPMPSPVGKVQHLKIPGSESEILVRIYTPEGNKPAKNWPVLVYYHGGGWVIGTLDTYDSSCRALCIDAQCIVVSVAYRQAPEHKWPAAPQDAYAAYQWVCEHAGEFNGDSANIAIGGESAGGNLAAVVTLMAKENNDPLPVHQLLIYPVVDLAEGPNSQSAKEYATAKPLNKPMLFWFYNHYLPAGADLRNPQISPLYSENLSGLPPVTLIAAEIDPLCSEGEQYALKLEAAGVIVNRQLYQGVTHEFFGMKGVVAEADDAIEFATTQLKLAFNDAMGFERKGLATNGQL